MTHVGEKVALGGVGGFRSMLRVAGAFVGLVQAQELPDQENNQQDR